MSGVHLAPLNVARLRAPLDDPALADFVALLDPVNALADGAPGFVWRLQTDEGNATSVRIFDDDMLIVNMSVWKSIESLTDFVYDGQHLGVMRRRREWFERTGDAYLVLWWVPAGHIPTTAEARDRLLQLRTRGPSPEAFTVRQPFPAATGPSL